MFILLEDTFSVFFLKKSPLDVGDNFEIMHFVRNFLLVNVLIMSSIGKFMRSK